MNANEIETSVRLVSVEAFEPGNATRYRLVLVEPADNDSNQTHIFGWLNAPGGGRLMEISGHGIVHASYLAEKLNYRNEADLRAILVWLGEQGIAVYLE